MKLWAAESGTLWLSEAVNCPPPSDFLQPNTTFGEATLEDLPRLQVSMNRPHPESIRARFETGRRCFCLRVARQIAAYGWVTRGRESVGELEREFDLQDDEVYIWDCATVPAFRRQRCYTNLLNRMIRQLHHEAIGRIWIGASRHNQPSIRGIVGAGFHHVMDMLYCRLGPMTFVYFRGARAARPAQIDAAYRVLTSKHERRLGGVAVGLYRDGPAARQTHLTSKAAP